MAKESPIVIRSYKKEGEMEIWKQTSSGRYALLKTYPICRWSGQLGPKKREGDRQAPEGFYTINTSQMNPNSSYYLSFDTGYPNAYDRSLGRTGAHLMVHGACSSSGCFAMTDAAIAEIYAIGRESFAGGQTSFQFQSFPFRMTAKNLAQHRLDPNMPFWKNLKEGSDYFEVTGQEPKISVCSQRYVFGSETGNCSPTPNLAVQAKTAHDEQEVTALATRGIPAVKLVYADGDQHESFKRGFTTGMQNVSRPEAVAAGPQEVVLAPGSGSRAMAFGPETTGDPASTPSEKVKKNLAAAPDLKPAQEEERPFYQRLMGGLF